MFQNTIYGKLLVFKHDLRMPEEIWVMIQRFADRSQVSEKTIKKLHEYITSCNFHDETLTLKREGNTTPFAEENPPEYLDKEEKFIMQYMINIRFNGYRISRLSRQYYKAVREEGWCWLYDSLYKKGKAYIGWIIHTNIPTKKICKELLPNVEDYFNSTKYCKYTLHFNCCNEVILFYFDFASSIYVMNTEFWKERANVEPAEFWRDLANVELAKDNNKKKKNQILLI